MTPEELNAAYYRAKGWNEAIRKAVKILKRRNVNADIVKEVRALDTSIQAIDDMEVSPIRGDGNG